MSERIKEKENINKAAVRRMAKRASLNTEIFSYTYISDSCAAAYIETKHSAVSFTSDDRCAAFVFLPAAAVQNSGSTFHARMAIDLYSAFGYTFSEHMPNEFSGAVVDKTRKAILLFRGASSAYSLYYTFIRDRFCFSTSVKGLFELSEIRPALSAVGLMHLFDFETSPFEGSTVYDGIFSLPPCSCVNCTLDGIYTVKHRIAEYDLCTKSPVCSSTVSGKKQCLTDERVLSLLSEAVILRDIPSYSAQEDVLRLHEMHCLDSAFDKIERAPIDLLRAHKPVYPMLPSAFVYAEHFPSFGPVLQAKLKAFMKDKTQSIHRILLSDTVLSCLSDPKQFEKSLFFILQLCLWLNHYKVYVAL